jgi:protein kinase
MQNYSEKIDIFALGCIMGEMFVGRPIFPGTSESDQLTRIVTVLGAPNRQEWPEGLQIATQKGISFPLVQSTPLRSHLQSSLKSDLSDDVIDLLQKMFKYNPEERFSA